MHARRGSLIRTSLRRTRGLGDRADSASTNLDDALRSWVGHPT